VTSTLDLVLYVVVPYLAIATFILGHVWRYRFDKFGWSNESSQLYERRWLEIGGPLFHYGAVLVIIGHVMGIVIPESWTVALGISEQHYSFVARVGGSIGFALCFAGMVILLLRRVINGRVRRATSRIDVVALFMLWTMVILGASATIGCNVFGPGYNYRPTIAEWWRGILTLRPDPAHPQGVPTIYLIRITVAWIFFALFPFTRFVHAWSVPFTCLTRPYVVYRRREPPTVYLARRRWQTIGCGKGP
jgi:nitrate reductase gamma subunit